MKFLIINFFILLIFNQIVFALDYSEDVRNTYTENIKQMCHASVEYNLDLPFDSTDNEDYNTAKFKYNETMECLFESAFTEATNRMNKDFNDKFFKQIFDFKNSDKVYQTKDLDKPTNCKEKGIDDLFEAQVENGYKTLCKIDGRKSTVEEIYSSCRVAEVAFNEFCAYQEYLLWKQTDETIRKESKVISKESHFLNVFNKKVEYDNEIDLSYRILFQTLEQFHTYVQNYRLHLWEKVIEDALIVTKRKFGLIKEAIYKWPIKFHNSAIQQ